MTALKALLARALTLVVGFVCGLTSSHLILTTYGADRYALYAIVASLPALVPFADLGTGAAVVNAFAESSENQPSESARTRMRSVFRITLAFAFVLVLVNAVLYLSGGWSRILGSAADVTSAESVAFVSVLVFSCSIPLGVWTRVLLGVQRNHIVVLIQGAQPVVTLILLWVMVVSGARLGSWAALASVAAALLISISGAFVADRSVGGLFFETFRQAPSWHRYPGSRVMNMGWPMLAQTLTPPITNQATRLIVAQSASLASLASYGLLMQVFLPLGSVISTAGLALWPYYIRAAARREKVIGPLAFSAIFFGAAVVVAVPLVVVGPWFFSLISNGTVMVRTVEVMWFAMQFAVQAAVYPLGMSMMDAKGLKFQVVPSLLVVLATVFGVSLFAPSLGIVSSPIIVSVAVVLLQYFPYVVYIWRRGRLQRSI